MLSIQVNEHIIDFNKSEKSLGVISNQLQVPRLAVQTTVSKYKVHGTVVLLPQSGRKTQTITCCWEMVKSHQKKNTIMQFYNESEAAGRQMLISTVRRVLHQHGLRGYRARKKPLLQTRHFKVCLKFAADHINKEKNLGVNSVVRWNNIFLLFCHNGLQYVWRWEGEALNLKNTTTTVKHILGAVLLHPCTCTYILN